MSRGLRPVSCPPDRHGSYWGVPTTPQAGLAPARDQRLSRRAATFGLITDGGIDMQRGSKRTDWKLVQVLEDVYSLGVGFERMPWSVN